MPSMGEGGGEGPGWGRGRRGEGHPGDQTEGSMPRIDQLVDQGIRTDVLVGGSEGTGARAAIAAADDGAAVLVATKGFVGKCGATLTADADIDVDSSTIAKLFTSMSASA